MRRTLMMATVDRIHQWTLATGALALLLASASMAAAEDSPLMPYRGMRPLALGNAFEAIADDLNALDYNPGGLANIRRLTLRVVPAQVRITKDLADEISELSDLIDEIDRVSQEEEQGILASESMDMLVERVEAIRRENLKTHASIAVVQLALPLPTVGGFKLVGAAGLSNQFQAGMRLRRTGLAWENEILDVLDDTFVIQGAVQMWTLQFAVAAEKSVSMVPYVKSVRGGVNWRIINRNYLDERFRLIDLIHSETFAEDHFNTEVEDGEVNSLGDIQEIIDNNTVKQTGTSFDVGVQVRHTEWLTSAYVIRSLISSFGDGGFPTTHTLAAAVQPLRALHMSNSLLRVLVSAGITSATLDDVLTEFENDSLSDNIHLGAEATLFPYSPMNFALRVGNNQGYPTIGVEARLAIIRIGAVYYGDVEADWWNAGMSFDF